MHASQYLLSTLKETPANTDAISHQLMLRAGMIRKLSSGLYIWLPTGFRILKKIENIIRDEMNSIGAIEISMPIMQPSDLWKKSSRWEQYGSELFNFIDRTKRSFVLGPTHEEVITDLVRKELSSYKQLPLIFFQIKTKFRDEIRPCLGVIRSREFLMKDAYSFHASQESLKKTYSRMYEVYGKIFSRIGLKFYVVEAEAGSIGGDVSHEFCAPIQHNKDNELLSVSSSFSEKNKSSKTKNEFFTYSKEIEKMRLVDTSNIKNIDELHKLFNLPKKKVVKTLLVKAADGKDYPLVALLIRGDHKINKKKVEKLSQVAIPLTFASEREIRSIINVGLNFLGPVNMPVPIIIDCAVASMNNFAAGANIEGKHFFDICWGRDLATPLIADIRDTTMENHFLKDKEKVKTERNIEVGHIFQLGTRYSQIVNASIQKKDGKNQILTMGCYGIGVTRVVAAVIEQNYDKYGIIWPDSIAPFQIAILPIDMHKSSGVHELAKKLYIELRKRKIDVLIDDRKERPGVMFSEIDLIGIPHAIIIGKKNLNKNKIEYKCRRSNRRQLVKVDEILEFLINTIGI